MEYFIGIDIGTTAIKGIIVSLTGDKIAEAKINTEFIYPEIGFIEYDPKIHYKAISTIIKKLAASVSDSSDIKSISMAVASGNTLFLDKDNKPLSNIISWMDERAVGLAPKDIDTDNLHNIVGWPWANGYLSMAHINWFKENEHQLFHKTKHICMNNDWLYFCLTGKWKLDTSTATTFYLQNQLQKNWHKPYLDTLSISIDSLSEIGLPGEIAGTIITKSAEETGLKEGTSVVLGTFDHPGAARGTGFTKPGDLLLSCGTSWVGFYPVESREKGISQHMLIDPFLSPRGPWGVMFSLPRIDLLINWFLDKFIVPEFSKNLSKYKLFDTLAAEAPPGANGCFIDPYISINDISASKNNSSNLTKHYSSFESRDIARALMEMTVFRVRKNIEDLAKEGIKAKRIAMVGGPSESPIWPQITSDITGLTLNLINGQTAGALGAAMLAAIGTGYFKDEEEAFKGMGGKAVVIEPNKSLLKVYDEFYREYTLQYEKKE